MAEIQKEKDRPQEFAKQSPIAAQQLRTRDRVFQTVGKTVDIALDSGEFVLESAGYATGRTVLAIGRTVKAMTQGVMGTTYRHAA
jgi:hypothetical protein